MLVVIETEVIDVLIIDKRFLGDDRVVVRM